MNFPRREEATNKELILTIIEIQGYLTRYGKSHTNWHDTLNEVIERLEWIPVSERLPKDHENVLIYLYSNQITIGLYNSHRLPFMDKPIGWGTDAPHGWSSDEVVAWMPLPKPYIAESKE